jgi:hypothetical protein
VIVPGVAAVARGLAVRVGPGRVGLDGIRVLVGVSLGGTVNVGAGVEVTPVGAAWVSVAEPAVDPRLGVRVSAGVVVGGLVPKDGLIKVGVGESVGTRLGRPVGTGGLSNFWLNANTAARIATRATIAKTNNIANCPLFGTRPRLIRLIGW